MAQQHHLTPYLKQLRLSGILQAQSGSPFDVRTAVDIAGVGPGSGNQFYNTVGDPNAVRVEWDDTINRATWFDKSE